MSIIFLVGCVKTPVVHYSQIHIANSASSFPDEKNDDYSALIRKVKGRQIGDTIFKPNTSAYWIIPAVDLADLRRTAEEENFEQNEYEGRLARILDTHRKYWIFSLDLRMPFYPGWTQERLLDYLQNNLVVSLETGGHTLLFPEREVFQVRERFGERGKVPSHGEDLEVRIPVRVYFRKHPDSESLMSQAIREVKIKLRLKHSPPFHIGFFDEKFYQGFVWKVTHLKNEIDNAHIQ